VNWHWLLFLPAVAYQLLAIASVLRFLSARPLQSDFRPPVSVLKPVLGLDPNSLRAFRSQAAQNYPDFELLFGVRNLGDPAVSAIEQLQREFPQVPIRLIQTTTHAPNGKVGSLIDLAREARHPVWLVNDGDIAVTPSYIREVVASLAAPGIGLVTCPYRAEAHSAATRWEALGIATDFMPSTMVAQTLGVRDFGLGSTLAFRAVDLAAVGGFEALQNYIADDFQLAHRIARTGKRALLSPYIVETSLGEGTWTGIWRHQLRWARTIRRSKGPGYAGLPITHAGLWALIALLFSAWPVFASLVTLRILVAVLAALGLKSKQTLALAWLAPAWDLFAFVIWIGAWTGSTVHWRNRILRIRPDGTIR
jgi:ceramide glucosyltransferase